jgi:hypothetical protein
MSHVPVTWQRPGWNIHIFSDISSIWAECPRTSSLVVRSLSLLSCSGPHTFLIRRYLSVSQSQSHIATDGQSISKSCCRAPDIYYSLTDTVLFLWGALSDERTGLPFVYAAGPASPLGLVTIFYCLRGYLHVESLLTAFSHPLRRILCWLNREHLVANFNFLFSDTTAASVFITAGPPLIRLLFPWLH